MVVMVAALIQAMILRAVHAVREHDAPAPAWNARTSRTSSASRR